MATGTVMGAADVVDTFEIAKLGIQAFSEIDPTFVRRHVTDLAKTWRIIKNDGTASEIVFNANEDVPVVVAGWTELQQLYALPNDVVVVVAFYGNNKFEVAAFKEVTSFEELPMFHSRYINHKGIYAFDVDLSEEIVSRTKLVELEF